MQASNVFTTRCKEPIQARNTRSVNVVPNYAMAGNTFTVRKKSRTTCTCIFVAGAKVPQSSA